MAADQDEIESNIIIKPGTEKFPLLKKSLRISTITVIGKCLKEDDQIIDLEEINQKIKIAKEWKKEDKTTWIRDMKSHIKKDKRKMGTFCNQITFLIEIDTKKTKNFKLFNNGTFQLTGCQTCVDAKQVAQIIFDEIKKIEKREEHTWELKITDIPMINTDCMLDLQIERDILAKLLYEEGYNPYFNPQTYQGVKCHYMINDKKNGKCVCVPQCVQIKRKKMTCEKISLMIFQSGNIIVTGANSLSNVVKAFTFIHNFILERLDQVKKHEISKERLNGIDLICLRRDQLISIDHLIDERKREQETENEWKII